MTGGGVKIENVTKKFSLHRSIDLIELVRAMVDFFNFCVNQKRKVRKTEGLFLSWKHYRYSIRLPGRDKVIKVI